jgi:hypothetical protein
MSNPFKKLQKNPCEENEKVLENRVYEFFVIILLSLNRCTLKCTVQYT